VIFVSRFKEIKVETYGGVVELDTKITNLTTTNLKKIKL
jgi:hypothetical protein